VSILKKLLEVIRADFGLIDMLYASFKRKMYGQFQNIYSTQ
jgi:hypothetical protein